MGEETFGIWCSPDLHIASSKEAADTTTTTPRRYRSDRSGRGGDACNAGKGIASPAACPVAGEPSRPHVPATVDSFFFFAAKWSISYS
jgi:hypothetical protein